MTPSWPSGGELKNTFCLARADDAWMSQHIGDMGSVETLAAFERSTRQFADMYRVDPGRSRPTRTPATRPAAGPRTHADEPVELVQHHHAHIAAVMAEHGVPAGERVIGFAFDGTGYGTDGAIWGGEVLVAGYDGFERSAHLRYVPLPGGDATIRKPYRAALAHLWAAGIEWAADLPPVGPRPGRASWPSCAASSNGVSHASRPRAWVGSSTRSARCSGCATSPPTRRRRRSSSSALASGRT